MIEIEKETVKVFSCQGCDSKGEAFRVKAENSMSRAWLHLCETCLGDFVDQAMDILNESAGPELGGI